MVGAPAEVAITAREIADELAARIVLGDIEPHTRLPSMRELAVGFGVSVPTAQRAVDRLSSTGLIRVADGKQAVAIDFANEATIESLAHLFDVAERAPETALRYLQDLLRLHNVIALDLFRDLLHQRPPAVVAALAADLATAKRRAAAAPDDPMVPATAEFAMYKGVCRGLDQIATVSLINTIEATLFRNRRLVAILYDDVEFAFGGWDGLVALLQAPGVEPGAPADPAAVRQVAEYLDLRTRRTIADFAAAFSLPQALEAP